MPRPINQLIVSLLTLTSLFSSMMAWIGLNCAYAEVEEATSSSLYKKADITTKVFLSDFEKVWKAALEATNGLEYMAVDEASGFIKTRWIDDTLDEQFYQLDWETFLASKVQLLILVKKGYRKGKDATLVSLYKKHRLIPTVPKEKSAKEAKEAGNLSLTPWKAVPTDGALEKTIIYRIKRLLNLERLLLLEKRKMEKEEAKKELDRQKSEEKEKAKGKGKARGLMKGKMKKAQAKGAEVQSKSMTTTTTTTSTSATTSKEEKKEKVKVRGQEAPKTDVPPDAGASLDVAGDKEKMKVKEAATKTPPAPTPTPGPTPETKTKAQDGKEKAPVK